MTGFKAPRAPTPEEARRYLAAFRERYPQVAAFWKARATNPLDASLFKDAPPMPKAPDLMPPIFRRAAARVAGAMSFCTIVMVEPDARPELATMAGNVRDELRQVFEFIETQARSPADMVARGTTGAIEALGERERDAALQAALRYIEHSLPASETPDDIREYRSLVARLRTLAGR
jgi:hypothetical protein